MYFRLLGDEVEVELEVGIEMGLTKKWNFEKALNFQAYEASKFQSKKFQSSVKEASKFDS
jgi:hypothetical protein